MPEEHQHGFDPASLFGAGSPFAAFGSLLGDSLIPGNGPECAACPFCLLLYGIRQARPEVVEHLLKASMEMMLALKAVVDAAAAKQEDTSSLRRIPIS